MAKCSKAPGINEGHSLQQNSFGYWYCEYGCGYKKAPSNKEQSRNVTRLAATRGFGNKNDKKLSKGKSRQNDPNSPVKSSSGCAVTAIGLLGGAAALLYGATDVIWRLVA